MNMKFLGQVSRNIVIIMYYVTDSGRNTSVETCKPSGGSTKLQSNYLFPET